MSGTILSFPVRAIAIDGTAVEPGQWFAARYGFSNVIGRCFAVLPDGMMLAFRWGGPFRSLQFVPWGSVLGRVPAPRLGRRLIAAFRRKPGSDCQSETKS